MEDSFIVEMWGAGSGAGLVGGDADLVGGMAAGIDPELTLALGKLIRKLRRKRLTTTRLRSTPNQPDRVAAMVNAILAVKAARLVSGG